jgi:hypothetical protein
MVEQATVYLRTDPRRELGTLERVLPDGLVIVFWHRTRRRWFYDPAQLARVKGAVAA